MGMLKTMQSTRHRRCRSPFTREVALQVLTIGRLLGHRDPATTLKYTHLTDCMVREAVDAVGAALEG